MDMNMDIDTEIHWEIGSCTYGGWQVPRSAVSKLQIQESQWCSFSLQAGRLETRKNGHVNSQTQEKTKFKGSQAGEILPYSWEGQPFSSFQAFNWLDGPTHIREGKVFYSVAYSNINHIQKHPHRHTQNNVWPNVWPPMSPNQVDTSN